MLDSKDIEILLFIQKNPLATLSQIARYIGLSVSNTSARIYKLEKVYKVYRNVQSDLNLKALNLEIYDFLFEVNSAKTLALIEEKLCHYHPYILFRGRCNGKINGIYLQFRAPAGSINYIEELVNILKTKGIIQNYQYIERDPIEPIIRIKSSLSSWDSQKQKWDFDWEEWKKGYQETSTENSSKKIKNENILGELTDLDIKLLAQLTIDAKRKNIEIMNQIGLKNDTGIAQRISRRLKFLKEKAVEDYRVFLNWELFDLFQSLIIKGKCEKEITNKIYNYLMNGIQTENSTTECKSLIFPFQGFFSKIEDGFFWYIRAPPRHLSEFINFIWEICDNYELYVLDYRYSQIYGLWDQAFDPEHKCWKLNYNFMIKNVLDKLL